MQLIMGMCVQCACVRLHSLIFHLHDDINLLCQMIMITNCFHFEIHFFSILAVSVEFNTLRGTEHKTHKMTHLNSTQKLDARIQFRMIASREMWLESIYWKCILCLDNFCVAMYKSYFICGELARRSFHVDVCERAYAECWWLVYDMLCFSVLLKNDERNTNEMFCNFPLPSVP